jgi:hypothetical protein
MWTQEKYNFEPRKKKPFWKRMSINFIERYFYLTCFATYAKAFGRRGVFCLFVYLSVFLTFYLSVFLSFCLSVFLSFCLSVFLSFCLSVFLSFCLSVFLSSCLSVCLLLEANIHQFTKPYFYSTCFATYA